VQTSSASVLSVETDTSHCWLGGSLYGQVRDGQRRHFEVSAWHLVPGRAIELAARPGSQNVGEPYMLTNYRRRYGIFAIGASFS
jgi:hypothetical protein